MSLHLHTRTHTHTDALSFSSLAFVNYFCTCRWICIGVAKKRLHIDVSTYFHTCTHTLSLSPLHSHSQTHTCVSIYRYTNLFKYTHIATHFFVASASFCGANFSGEYTVLDNKGHEHTVFDSAPCWRGHM